MAQAVDFVVNVYERTYRDVLAPGWFQRVTDPMEFPFARKVALINNVMNPAEARGRADALIEAGELQEAYFVSDYIGSALARLGLRPRDLGPVPHFSDCAFVALGLSGSPWLLYWDADLVQVRPGDWVSPSLTLLGNDPRVVVASPAWHPALPQDEAETVVGGFALGYGFSDLAFLCRRSDFITQDWRKRMVPASYRYPLSPVAPVFEQRVDSWMRRAKLLRATNLDVLVEHQAGEGGNYPRTWGTRSRWRNRLQRRALALGSRIAPRDPRFNPHPRSLGGNSLS